MITITLTNRLSLSDVPDNLKNVVCARLTFENPAWLDNEKMGRWNGNTPHYLRLYRTAESGLILPRGFIRQAISLCKQHEVRFELQDQRRALKPIAFHLEGELRDFQREAVNAMLAKDFGTLSAPTGSGKTVMALSLIAERKQPALIVVHSKELLSQWTARIETFLRIPKDHIGIIGNGKWEIGKQITVATVQSLLKVADEVSAYIGHLVIDECHHCPSRTFTDVVTAFDSKYMLGLSATPWRRDGLSKLIFWHVGDVIHKIEKAGLVENGNIVPFDVTRIETNFQSSYDPSAEYSSMLSELTEDRERNQLIADTVIANRHSGGISLVLSDRKAHCDRLRDLLTRDGVYAEILTGGCTSKERTEIVERLNRGEIKILIATGQLIGEGFDLPALTTLFITTPIKFSGRLIQYLGRVLRPAHGKEKARVFDFVDAQVGPLKAAAWSRQRVYAGLSGADEE
jgi:superfamily II DNA or RNA helicase